MSISRSQEHNSKNAKTLYEKIWEDHIIGDPSASPAVFYIDLHLIHEVTSPQAFDGLRKRKMAVRRPAQTFGTVDHSIPTLDPSLPIADDLAEAQISKLEENCRQFGITLFDRSSPQRGIVHVIGSELGLTQPGMTIVCGDSHTATHGAFGALAFGIGTSEVEHVLASQSLLQSRAKSMRVTIDGRLKSGVLAKDLILALISKVGVSGGTGHVIEYAGSAIRVLDMDGRMTVCNMSIEAGARAGMIAPDETTFAYLEGRPYAPKGRAFEQAVARWQTLPSDPEAVFDKEVALDAGDLAPMITFGTNPAMAMPVDGTIPDPKVLSETDQREALYKALRYMQFAPGDRLLGKAVDVVFIGSCTNGRMADLRDAARILRGRRVAPQVRVLIVPGSQAIKRQAEAEGLHRIFIDAGAEWRESGCSMCIAMNGDELQPGQISVSTSNRNFEGRQGKAGRTLLASPITAAAAAVTGTVTDVRTLL
ncbi:MAG TPA: 3-isopropylmalate dehydratase large subunit [bacterium]|nr:3-isopropylmalate dehydratase large subunit [bacterium]HPG44377.1 3-isopropylmalate dehydratase large subunit [bacterium]HPM96935.1 3-isopropylmalate dehydratase large subunit [bacterium]